VGRQWTRTSSYCLPRSCFGLCEASMPPGSSSPRLHPATGLRHFSPLFYCSFCDSAQFFQASRASFLAGSPTSDAPPAALGLRAAFIRRTTSSPSASRHLRRVAYPEGTPLYLSTGNFHFITLADIFSPEYFLPLCYRTPSYYWERTSSVCIMHLYSIIMMSFIC